MESILCSTCRFSEAGTASTVFENMIQDVAWLPTGHSFIVISGTQPATATLYDKDCNPLFEFGKRYRNTIRVCPFS
jgi:translation initiation factor 2A